MKRAAAKSKSVCSKAVTFLFQMPGTVEKGAIDATNLPAFFFTRVPEFGVEAIRYLFDGLEHARRFAHDTGNITEVTVTTDTKKVVIALIAPPARIYCPGDYYFESSAEKLFLLLQYFTLLRSHPDWFIQLRSGIPILIPLTLREKYRN